MNKVFRVRRAQGRHVAAVDDEQDARAVLAHFLDLGAESPLALEFELEAPQEARIDLADFLIREKGWPACAFTAHAVAEFARAVRRRYVEARGFEPPRDRGDVYRGFTDWLIVRDTYDEEMGALVEQLVAEGGAS